MAADGQSGERRVWLKHTNGYFRLIGCFSGAVALGSTVTLIARMGGPEMNSFLVFVCMNFTNISLQMLSFCLGKKRVDLTLSFSEEAQYR